MSNGLRVSRQIGPSLAARDSNHAEDWGDAAELSLIITPDSIRKGT